MKKNKRSFRFTVLKRRQTLIIFCLLAVLALPLSMRAEPFSLHQSRQQQTYLVKGRVTDQKDIPLPGVTVKPEGVNTGTATDKDGNFALWLPDNRGVLVFSFIGYKSLRQSYVAGRPLQVRLQESVEELEEVQVVAYGEQRQRDVVGAIAGIKADALKDGAGGDLVGKLQGKLAGVSVASPSGAPGYTGSITIRGHNSLSVEAGRVGSEPLWVVDGVPMYTGNDLTTGQSPLATIPSSEIERIDVLKDAASCAMYGSRAANGVILITTKSGRLNEKFRVSVSVTQSYSFCSNLPRMTVGNAERGFRLEALRNYTEAVYDYEDNSQHYIGSPEEAEDEGKHKDFFWNKGQGATLRYLQDSLNPFYNNANNWFKYIFRVRKVTDANIGFSGGSDKMAFYLGIGYYKERGALVGTGFQRASLSGNVIFKPNDRLSGRIGYSFTRTATERPDKDMDGYNPENDVMAIPEIPVQYFTTSPLMLREGSAAFDNFVNGRSFMREENESYRFRVNLNLGYKVTDGLEVKTSLSFDYLGAHRNTFLPMEMNAYKRSYSSGRDSRNLSGLNENMLVYEKNFSEDHRVRAVAGISLQMDQFNDITGYGYGNEEKIYFVSWLGSTFDPLTKDQLKEFNTDKSKSALISVFARLGYSYKNKYIIEGVFRRDGSSRFGRNTRWGTFPSVAVGYAFSEEQFMESIRHVLSAGKLRLSWGKTGKQFEDPYLAQGIYGGGAFTFQGKPTMNAMMLPNPGLTWENTYQFDAGLDLSLFNYRLKLKGDYYHRLTTDMLYYQLIAGDYSGFKLQWNNLFSISNQGIELSLDWNVVRREEGSLSIGFNIARNWNRLEKTQDDRSVVHPRSTNNISVVGKELNRIYVLDDRGFYKSQEEVPTYYRGDRKYYLGLYNQYYRKGDRKITDIDGNGFINTIRNLQDDRIDAGSPLPKAYGGINITAAYKGFDLTLNMPFSLGRHVLYGGVVSSLATVPGSQSPIFGDLRDYVFYKEGAGYYNMPRNEAAGELNNFASGLLSNVYKVNYLKLGLVSLGYTFSRKMIRFADVRIFISGENLFKISRFPGYDPELGHPVTGVYNLNAYPHSGTVNFGVNVNF